MSLYLLISFVDDYVMRLYEIPRLLLIASILANLYSLTRSRCRCYEPVPPGYLRYGSEYFKFGDWNFVGTRRKFLDNMELPIFKGDRYSSKLLGAPHLFDPSSASMNASLFRRHIFRSTLEVSLACFIE